MFKGCMTALVTPMKEGGVDERALRSLVDWQIENGIHGLVPCGTTGESATLDYEEHQKVTEIVIEQAGGRVPVIAGSGSNSTWEAVKLTRHAKEAGAHAALLITPYYNKPTQEGLFRHFQAIAKEVDIPVILYNVPGRTGVNLAPETVGRLSKIDNVVGIKDAANDIKQTIDTMDACHGDITVLSGDDFATLAIMAVGGKGAISVSSNLVPGLGAEMANAWERGDSGRAARIQHKIHELNRCMFLETNPIPVKWGVHRMGMCGEEIRLPLTPLDAKHRPRLEAAMKELELI